jgi:hypothetical protein
MTALAEAAPATAAEQVFALVTAAPAPTTTTRAVTTSTVAPPAETTLAAITATRAAAGSSAPCALGTRATAVATTPAPPEAPNALPVAPTPDAGSPAPTEASALLSVTPAPNAGSPTPVPGPATPRPAVSSPGPLPRLRLAPALPPARARVATTPLPGRPPTLDERIHVLRAGDRSLVLEASDWAHDRDGCAVAPDPGVVVRRLATAAVEVIAGNRPAAQLARWLAPGVLDALRERAGLSRHTALRHCRTPTCRSVHVCLVTGRVVEATAVVDDGRRVRAIAVRLETHRGAWRATALEVG